MGRRKIRNRTGIPRIEGIPVHDAWVGFICAECSKLSLLRIGRELLGPEEVYVGAEWVCTSCGFVHSRNTNLPFESWPRVLRSGSGIAAQRFWQAFFRSATEAPEVYWKQCNACGRILPFRAFSRHKGWGPLERQMECRSCKAAINAKLNPKRTREQLHEGSARRRVAEMFLEGENERIDLKDLFSRFNGCCFKTGKALNVAKRSTWAIDHILPSKFLYPLTAANAALLSREANENKRDRWPSDFYTNSELIRLAKITGADLLLLSEPKPVINQAIDVNACVARTLRVRERSDLRKRIMQLKRLIRAYGFVESLSEKNSKLLGFK